MNDPVSTSMFWVGAMFAFTPVIVGGTVIAIWWWKRKHDDNAEKQAGSASAEL